MKKIVPFNNVLTFNTDVREITAISLEHDIKTEEDAISGTFYITGEYKITDGQLDKEKFSFELPFDIALGCNYNLDTIVVDIDDFRYELLDRNKLKVNIDLYIDGEVVEPVKDKENDELFTEAEIREMSNNMEEESTLDSNPSEKPTREETITPEQVKMTEEPVITPISDNLDLLDKMLKDKKEEKMEEKETEINIENDNENNNINIFNGFNEEEQYVTYHVYPVTENDTLDKIIEKYNVTKEDLAKYNNIEDIHTGDKLIIPANNNDK